MESVTTPLLMRGRGGGGEDVGLNLYGQRRGGDGMDLRSGGGPGWDRGSVGKGRVGWEGDMGVSDVERRARRGTIIGTALTVVVFGFGVERLLSLVGASSSLSSAAANGRVVTFGRGLVVGLFAVCVCVAEATIRSSIKFVPEVGTVYSRRLKQLLMPRSLLLTLILGLTGSLQCPAIVILFFGSSGISLDYLTLEVFLGFITGVCYSVYMLINDCNVIRFPPVLLSFSTPRVSYGPLLKKAVQETYHPMTWFSLLAVFFSLAVVQEPVGHFLTFLGPMLVTSSFCLFTWSRCQTLLALYFTLIPTSALPVDPLPGTSTAAREGRGGTHQSRLLDALHAAERGTALVNDANSKRVHVQMLGLVAVRNLACGPRQFRAAFFEDPSGRTFDRAVRVAMEPNDALTQILVNTSESTARNPNYSRVKPLFWDASRVRWGLETVASLLVHARHEDVYGVALPYLPVVLAGLLASYEAILPHGRTTIFFDEYFGEKAEATSLLDFVICAAHRVINTYRDHFEAYLHGSEPQWSGELSPTLAKFLRFQEL